MHEHKDRDVKRFLFSAPQGAGFFTQDFHHAAPPEPCTSPMIHLPMLSFFMTGFELLFGQVLKTGRPGVPPLPPEGAQTLDEGCLGVNLPP